MKLACVRAIAAPAVAKAAMASGIANRPITDFAAYEEKLSQFIYRTGLLMKPVYDRARADQRRIVYAEGEEETVLRAVQTVIDEQLARPILIGRPDVIVWFFLDTHVQLDPSAEQSAAATLQATYRLKLFGVEPKVALLSHSDFGSHDNPSAAKMRKVREILKARVPKLEMDGEMMADTAWDDELRHRIFPNTTLKGRANLFVLPNLDAANIVYNMVKVMTDGVALGPILMGLDQPAHILTPASTTRRVVNMSAIAAVDAQIRRAQRVPGRSAVGE